MGNKTVLLVEDDLEIRDILQDVIVALRNHDFGIDMQFTNYRSN